MLVQNILVLAPFLALVAAVPASTFSAPVPKGTHTPVPPTFPDAPFTPTTEGTRPGQGAHAVPPTSGFQAAALSGIGSVVTGKGLNWYNPDFASGNRGYQDKNYYWCFRGIKENFPPIQNWMNFNDMFNLNQQESMVHVDSGPEQGEIYNAIVQVSREAKVDARLILAVIMQESSGNVRVPCTNNGIVNCGLMQAYTGSVSYNPNNMKNSILQMVRDGTQGTSVGPGYVQWITQNSQTQYAGNTDGNVYQASRGYNSGQINFANLSDGAGATDAYVSDLANRLQGWNGRSCGNPAWLACNWKAKAWC